MNEAKAALRQALLARRAALPQEERRRASAAMAAALERSPLFEAADCLLGYMPMGSEPDLRSLLALALRRGKRLALPRCEAGGQLRFYCLPDLAEMESLAPGSYGIPEPDPERLTELNPAEAALCLVPGLSFDGSGYRLGYGKGYYDRFLRRFPGVALGVCYEQLREERLPREAHDLPVAWLLTQNGMNSLHERE
ncbi:MAG: 5-formyltetrahydrofolate cyclo-ligase [Oscillospiraceae bacterium]|jgi:5-formyltetrahydrofolate cyclo-ligase|nr:5-formyltetrahydrofolate cyclo-ligase [Oscillospiraceae bacterium]